MCEGCSVRPTSKTLAVLKTEPTSGVDRRARERQDSDNGEESAHTSAIERGDSHRRPPPHNWQHHHGERSQVRWGGIFVKGVAPKLIHTSVTGQPSCCRRDE